MSTFYLINTTTVGTVKYFAGRLMNDAIDPVSAVEAAGGVCWPSADAGVTAAALVVTDLRAKGADENLCNAVMMAAAAQSASGDESTLGDDLASTASGKGAALVGIATGTGLAS